MSRLGIVIQARTGSSRLPGKVLRSFHDGQSLLEYLLAGLETITSSLPIVLATSTNVNDDEIQKLGTRRGVEVFRGSEEDVHNRFLSAAHTFNLDGVIRLTADNPFVDGTLVEQFSECWNPATMDYLSNKIGNGYPIGSDVEIVATSTLESLQALSLTPEEKEHVTLGVYTRHKSVFRLQSVSRPVDKLSTARLTVDTESEFGEAKVLAAKLVRSPQQPTWILAAREQLRLGP